MHPAGRQASSETFLCVLIHNFVTLTVTFSPHSGSVMKAPVRGERDLIQTSVTTPNPETGPMKNRKPSPQLNPAHAAHVDALLQEGIDKQQRGELQGAKTLYQKILAIDPGHADANHLLGLTERLMGNHQAAAKHITRAIATRPEEMAYYNNLGLIHRETGQFEKALACYRKAGTLDPENLAVHNNIGVVLQAQGKHAEAIPEFKKALASAPRYVEAHNNLGLSFLAIEDANAAAAAFLAATRLQSGNANLHNNLGWALCLAERFDAAIPVLLKAIQLQPQAGFYSNLGRAYAGLDHIDQAIKAYHQAIALNPGFIDAHYNLGRMLSQAGQTEPALAAYRQTLARDPDHSEAHRGIANLVRHSTENSDTEALRVAYERAEPGGLHRMHLAFALGKIGEDQKAYQTAFDYVLEANAIRRANYAYDSTQEQVKADRIREIFTPALFEKHKETGDPDDAPIFILGMPRSGTSLVEQILASHPQVHGAGELRFLAEPMRANGMIGDNGLMAPQIADMPSEHFGQLGTDYLEKLHKLAPEARFITDKMPTNFWRIGLIKLMLPNAKIIHCRRSAADNCLSIFKNYFAGNGLRYAYDLRELGNYHNVYRTLMGHWHQVLPGAIHDVDYEKLVADQEGETRALLAHCGLDWDPAVLDFHKNERQVKTASFSQVRQPIYKTSVKLADRYGEALNPLLEVLAEGPVDG